MATAQLFITYAVEDTLFAEKLVADLGDAGETVSNDIREAKVLIVIVSPDTAGAPTVLEQIKYALLQTFRLIPVLIKIITVVVKTTQDRPAMLDSSTFIDFTKEYKGAFKVLLDTIHASLLQNARAEYDYAMGTVWEISPDEEEEEPSGNPAEDVHCSVFAPETVWPGNSFLVQIFAHLRRNRSEAASLARLYDRETAQRGSTQLEEKVEQGTRLTFCLSMPGVEIDEAVQHLLWRGETAALQFGVSVPAEREEGNAIGTVQVSSDGVPIGHIKFAVRLAKRFVPYFYWPEEKAWKRYKYAFISYASPDRPEVLKRVQMLERFGIDYFQDVLTLEPGEEWAKRLNEEIKKSDVFFLFWSTAAKNSTWVMQEVRYALERQGETQTGAPEIVPVIIEGPPPVPPPQELKHLHFNDTFIYFINAGKVS